MTAVRHTTGLHEATVQQANDHAAAHKASRPRVARQQRATRVVTKPVAHPLAWAAAMRLAGGDHHRLRVVDYTTVMVDG